MANNPGISEVVDKDGVTADIEAKRFDGTRTINLQGDVSGTQTWNGDSSTALTINASIGAKKVTQDKIGDKAVGTGQMADGSVGLTQIAASAMTDSVSANNSKLVTSQGVNAAIAAATLNRGKDYGPMSVDEINAISETIPTGSTVYVEHLGAGNAKVINDGYSDGTMASFSVEVGEDLKYYRAPDNSLHGWHSTEANVKIKQPANYSGGIAVDSAQDASSGSAGIEFIQSFKQNTNGDITNIVKAQLDLVDSTSSTRTNAAATPNSVKSAYDLANGKYSKPSGGIPKSDLAIGVQASLDKADSALQPTGDGKDVTVSFSEASTRENIGTGEKLSVMFGKTKKWFTDLKALAFKDTVSDSDISGTISDNHIASASTWNGKADKVSGATNGNFASLDSNGNLTDSGKKASDFATAAQGTAADNAVKDVTVGGTSVVDSNTKVAALGTAAGKDVPASGNASTTQVVMGVDSRLEAINLNNANDLDDYTGVFGEVLLYRWGASSMPSNAPVNGTSFMEVVRTHNTDNYVTQTVYVANKSSVYRRESMRVSSVWTWTEWYEYAKSATTLAGYGITDAYTKTEVDSALASKVTGPSSATADDIAVFDGATGKLVKDSGKKATDFVQSVKIGSGSELKDASGNVSIPVDSTPTVSSPNLMTSGDIKTALDAKQDGVPVLLYGIKVVKKITSAANNDVGFEVFTNYNASAVKVKVAAKLLAGTTSVPYNTGSTLRRYADGYPIKLLSKVYYKVDGDNIEIYFLNGEEVYGRNCIVETTAMSSSMVSYELLTSQISITGLTEISYTNNALGSYIPYASADVGNTSTPVYADSNGEVKPCNGTVDWQRKYNGYKEVTFTTETLATFMSNASVTGSLANKLFGSDFDSTNIVVDAIGRVDLGTDGLQTLIGAPSRYALFVFSASRQRGYLDLVFQAGTTSTGYTLTMRFSVDMYGELSRRTDLITTNDLATTDKAGIVKFMITAEATAIWDRAWAAATPS